MPDSSSSRSGTILLDIFLLTIENLLAYRVVFSYLGIQNTLIHRLTDLLILPFKPLAQVTTYISDSSILELLPAFLVVVLFFLHRQLDRSLEEGGV
jgi:hypothetical protein